jgi:hypothetical protein
VCIALIFSLSGWHEIYTSEYSGYDSHCIVKDEKLGIKHNVHATLRLVDYSHTIVIIRGGSGLEDNSLVRYVKP